MIALHFGAGNIGRGLIGNVLNNNNYQIIFVDTNEKIINQINANNNYKVEYFDNNYSMTDVLNVKALNSLTENEKIIELIQNVDIITTSIGANNLTKIAPLIKKGLIKRCKKNKTLNLLANENVINASTILKEEIFKISTKAEISDIDKYCYFPNTTIDRQSLSKVVNGDNIAYVEPYFEWVIDRTKMLEAEQYLSKGVLLVDDLKPYIERKLFIVNAEHVAFAYLGYLFGYSTIQEAAKDNRIINFVRGYLKENKKYFIKEYGMEEEELNDYIEQTIKRHTLSNISDDIYRVGRDPIRKLNENDRLVSPVRKLEDLGLENNIGKRIIVAAYFYENTDDQESVNIQEKIRKYGIENTIKYISGINGELLKELVSLYENIKKDKENIFAF